MKKDTGLLEAAKMLVAYLDEGSAEHEELLDRVAQNAIDNDSIPSMKSLKRVILYKAKKAITATEGK